MNKQKKPKKIIFLSVIAALAGLLYQNNAFAACADDWLGVDEVSDGEPAIGANTWRN